MKYYNSAWKWRASNLFSNITRDKKYESNVTLELPKNFHDKSVMAQARLKAAAMKINPKSRKSLYGKTTAQRIHASDY